MRRPTSIAPPKGKLGILTPGMGAVSTTFMAGVELVRKGGALPVGSLTQLATIRLGKRTERRSPLIREFLPLEKLDNLVFGGWDIFPDTAYEAARKAGVLEPHHLEQVKGLLSSIRPMKGAFDQAYVKKLEGRHVKKAKTKFDLAEEIKDDKTGQTLLKTILAPGFKARMLGLNGWFSTNILGNRDGEVLDDPESFKTKEESKLGVLEYILQAQLYPQLYGKMYHKVRINYYPPRGDNKEGWDNIDIFGWLGYRGVPVPAAIVARSCAGKPASEPFRLYF